MSIAAGTRAPQPVQRVIMGCRRSRRRRRALCAMPCRPRRRCTSRAAVPICCKCGIGLPPITTYLSSASLMPLLPIDTPARFSPARRQAWAQTAPASLPPLLPSRQICPQRTALGASGRILPLRVVGIPGLAVKRVLLGDLGDVQSYANPPGHRTWPCSPLPNLWHDAELLDNVSCNPALDDPSFWCMIDAAVE